MSASPYREPASTPPPVARWTATRVTDLAFKVSAFGIAIALAGAALLAHLGARLSRPGLSREQIAAVIRAHATDTVTCWVRDHDLTGRSVDEATTGPVTIYATIDGAGHVSQAAWDGTSGSVASCLEDVFRAWDFPATGTVTRSAALPFKYVDP